MNLEGEMSKRELLDVVFDERFSEFTAKGIIADLNIRIWKKTGKTLKSEVREKLVEYTKVRLIGIVNEVKSQIRGDAE